MALLARRKNAFDDLFDFRRDFENNFNRLVTGSMGDQATRFLVAVPPIEAWVDKEDKNYHLSIALPGVDPKDVEVNVQGNNLTVTGEQKNRTEKKETDYLQQEFTYGRFERTIVLPEGVDTEKLSAEYKNGVLELTAPLSSAALPRRIEIKSLPQAKGATA